MPLGGGLGWILALQRRPSLIPGTCEHVRFYGQRNSELQIMRQGDDLDNLGGISVITRILVRGDRRVRSRDGKTETEVREERKCDTAESEGGGRD